MWCILIRRSFNSIILSVTTANEYAAFYVAADFSQSQTFGSYLDAICANPFTPPSSSTKRQIPQAAHWLQSNASAGILVRLDIPECIGAYLSDSADPYTNVALVTNATGSGLGDSDLYQNLNTSTSILGCAFGISKSQSYQYLDSTPIWICDHAPASCDDSSLLRPYISSGQGGSQTLLVASVQYCLVQKAKNPSCAIEISSWSLIIVFAPNLNQFLFFVIAVAKQDFDPFVTLGDAISSFLRNPD